MGKNILLWVIVLAVMLTVVNNFGTAEIDKALAYSDFVDLVEQGEIRNAVIQGNEILAEDGAGEKYSVVGFQYDPALSEVLRENRVRFEIKQPEKQSVWTQLLVASFPILIILAVALFFMRQMQGGAGGKGGFISRVRSSTKSRSQSLSPSSRILRSRELLPVPPCSK